MAALTTVDKNDNNNQNKKRKLTNVSNGEDIQGKNNNFRNAAVNIQFTIGCGPKDGKFSISNNCEKRQYCITKDVKLKRFQQ